jgi:hypothetical protein
VSSETRFSLSHPGFWNALLPMGESYIRAKNAKPNRFATSFPSLVPASQRGVVNESAFLLFEAACKLSILPAQLTQKLVDQKLNEAFAYVSKLQQSGREPLQAVSVLGKYDAKAIAERLHHFFASNTDCALQLKPMFPGCGWIDSAEGDVLCGQTLFEVKAGERQFRISDVRQLLCYCALDFSAKVYGIKTISLVNPRFGVFIEEDIEVLCQKVGGTSSADVLGEIVDYISEPMSRYP